MYVVFSLFNLFSLNLLIYRDSTRPSCKGNPVEELGLRLVWVRVLAQGTHVDSNPLPFGCESKVLPLYHHTPHRVSRFANDNFCFFTFKDKLIKKSFTVC